MKFNTYKYALINTVFGIVIIVGMMIFSATHLSGINLAIMILFCTGFLCFLISLFSFYKNIIVSLSIDGDYVTMTKANGKAIQKNIYDCKAIQLSAPRIVLVFQNDKSKYRIIRQGRLLILNDIDLSLLTEKNFPNALIK